ncbi:hypothetical protein TrRE_jg13399 [Triparma retinervis]|uniref:Uncharacterized protein n=1 Tax=Triparma retinervis TaxID=2557542 RepID=A0A9W6ZCD2_9STRA|nr:hypothetical protein TrRE_jg13399 [Triparma retinervis]
MIFDFESTSRANSEEMNAQAVGLAQKASRRVEEGCGYMRKSLDLMETKIGRVRIDFDRMVGDTTSACEALADGLSVVRGDVRSVNGKQMAFEKSLVERGGMGRGGAVGGGIGGGGGFGGGTGGYAGFR